MAYRNLLITGSAKLSVKNKQLLITADSQHSIPLEDINSVVLESCQSNITTAALSQMAQNGAAVFVCDKKHTPCAVLLPFAQYSRSYGMFKLQESISSPLQKQLWQQIVKAKISNQAKCLKLLGKYADAKYLYNLVKHVLSGDTSNVEAAAANYYFRCLFDADFYRSNDADMRNAFLNYGYAIIRGHLARLIASYGLLPMKGIHHKSELNAYNLADDFIEPFRPVVDLYVASLENPEYLSTEYKGALYNLLNVDISFNEQKQSVAYAAEKMIQSFIRCCQNKTKTLSLPCLIELQQHAYE